MLRFSEQKGVLKSNKSTAVLFELFDFRLSDSEKEQYVNASHHFGTEISARDFSAGGCTCRNFPMRNIRAKMTLAEISGAEMVGSLCKTVPFLPGPMCTALVLTALCFGT